MFRYCSLPDSQLFLEIFPNCCLSELSNWIETVKVHRIDMITFLISSGFSGCSNIITTAPKAHNAEIDTSFRIREDCIWAAFQAGLVDIAQVLQSAGGDLGWMEAASLDLPSLNSISRGCVVTQPAFIAIFKCNTSAIDTSLCIGCV
ncbi:hypothetical protein BASA61_000494 [Batrachochytrium salamandrivorans]|nr:hypothetical protein BASA61_000494 [Batrachochytrium salamandrivorans]